MKDVLLVIVNWAEVWAPLIPLVVYLVFKPRQKWISPLLFYVVFAFMINLMIDLIWKRNDINLDGWMHKNLGYFYNSNGDFDNTLLYNIHSITRFFLFAWFFSFLGKIFKKLMPVGILIFVAIAVITFGFYQDIRDFSSLLLAGEAAGLLIYCLIYYFVMLRNEDITIKNNPEFWTVTGLSLFVVINFPIFLFYTALLKPAEQFAIDLWDIHNICYIILCCFIAKSFYAASSRH